MSTKDERLSRRIKELRMQPLDETRKLYFTQLRINLTLTKDFLESTDDEFFRKFVSEIVEEHMREFWLEKGPEGPES